MEGSQAGGIFSKLWPFTLMELVLGAQLTQVMAILNYFAHFAVYPFIGTVLFLYMIFSQYWYIAAIYLAWYVYDAKTPQNGGRSFTISHNWKAWKDLRDFFPITLHKDADLDPKKNYIFGYHPHGMTVYGAFVNFGVACTGFDKLFPGLKPKLLTIEAYYKFPVYRDYLMMSGLVSVHRDSYRAVLSNEDGGTAAVVVPGGAEEALDCAPEKMTIILSTRRGFIKMAIRTGAQLVPVLSFGENETYRQANNPRGSLLRKIQTNMMHLISFSTPVFYGQHGTIIPFKVPINTVDSEHPCNGSQPPTEDISIMTQVMTAGSLAHLYGMSLGMGTLSENGLKIMMTGDEALVQDGFYIVFSPAVSESVLSDLKESSILLTDGTL